MTARPCELGADHRPASNDPLSPSRRRAARRLNKEGRSVEWLCSHFGATRRAIKAALPKSKPMPKRPRGRPRKNAPPPVVAPAEQTAVEA